MLNHSDKLARVVITLEFDLFPDADTKRLMEELHETLRCHIDGDWSIEEQFKSSIPKLT